MIDDFDPTPPLTWLERLCAFLTGVDPKILVQCPMRDRAAVVIIGLIMMGVGLWQALAFAFTFHMFLAQPGEVRPELVAVAALFAGLILLMDGFMVIRPSWWVSGLEQIKRGGMELPGYQAAKIKNGVLNVFRIALAFVPAEATALAVALLIFRAELIQTLNADAVQRNFALYQQIAARDDGETAQVAGRMAGLQKAHAEAAANVEALRGDPLRVPADDTELAAATARIPVLEAAKLEAEKRLAALPPATSRAEGTRRATAQRLLAARRTDLEKAQASQDALRRRADAVRQDHGTTVSARLKEAVRAEADYQTRLTNVAAELAQRNAGRTDRIRTALEQDAAYVPPDRGILARLRVLARLSEDGWNYFLILLIHAFFLSIELGAVLSKVLSSVPSHYAARLAGEEYATEVEIVDEVYRRIGTAGRGAQPAAPEDAGENPEAPVPEAANDDVPPEGEASDTEERLRDGARTARAQAAARAKAKKAGAKPADVAGDADQAQEADDQASGPARRGPGRPPGARNKPKPANDDRPPAEEGQDVA